ncbi:glycosyltransferase [Prevotella falsenii]|uniref:glycosyltransferase n=1 Tax=Prevotella falsenii TaxID=515414 RepID=UPI000687F424|nr:glycosyltransferase [Prevotella falsenii]
MFTAFNEILPELCNHKEIANNYSITFLGKGWNFAVDKLQEAGYETYQIDFVDVYLDEIIKYDIQLTPISVGTGTKGKVLDALANGLLIIGTPYAMENIAVENNKSCIIYKDAKQLISILKEIPLQKEKYEVMAEEGRKCVLTMHDRKKVAKELFDLF